MRHIAQRLTSLYRALLDLFYCAAHRVAEASRRGADSSPLPPLKVSVVSRAARVDHIDGTVDNEDRDVSRAARVDHIDGTVENEDPEDGAPSAEESKTFMTADKAAEEIDHDTFEFPTSVKLPSCAKEVPRCFCSADPFTRRSPPCHFDRMFIPLPL